MRRLLSMLALLSTITPLQAEWLTYKGNAARSNFTEEPLPTKLALRWVVNEMHAPTPAWPASNRLQFDWAAQPVVAGDRIFYGSSTDHHVYALDAVTGKVIWTFATGGPIRFAPALWKDRQFVASDDGWLYCLSNADGKLLWKKQGGPDDRKILGNDRLISRWPARGGPVAFEDVVYFAAGIWPSEGIYIYALEPATGKVIWCNDSSGSIFMGQPHGGANAASGVAAQGYLVVNGDQLLVPTGRAVPAVFERATGKFKYFQLQSNGHKGGAATTALGPFFFNAGFTYDATTGKILDPVGAGDVAALPEGILLSSVKDITAFKWVDKSKVEKNLALFRYKGLEKTWTIPGVMGGASVLVAGNTVVAGGPNKITVADRDKKAATWSTKVDGIPFGLAAAGGRLFVSTDKGHLYCFDAPGFGKAVVHDRRIKTKLTDGDAVARKTAEEIVAASGITEGFCADLACGDGSLAIELAKRTKLQIHAIDADLEKVKQARERLMALGLYGSRVTVHHGDPAKSQFPKHYANLVVSGRSVDESKTALPAHEAERLQRPFGGVRMVGAAGAMDKNVRGPLEGAGSWTHQYADPGNSCCSVDNLVQGQLGMLWFRDSDLESPSRHGRAPAPLCFEGRLFVEGTHALRAVDAYNGRTLWETPLPNVLKPYAGEHLMGTAGTQSNYCVNSHGVFLRQGSQCFRFDPATGQKLGTFDAPPGPDGKPLPWGYLAVEGDRLFGSLSDPKHVVKYPYGKSDMNHLFTESTVLFALDVKTGKKLWFYEAKHSIRHNAIAIGKDKVFLIDRPVAVKDLLSGEQKEKEHPLGELLALDAGSGQVAWRSKHDAYGTVLSVSNAHDVLVMSYQPTRFKLPSEIGGRMAAFKASTGASLWDQEATYGTRPLINGKTIYAQGGSWDLLKGDAKTFPLKRSYGCGQLAGSTHMMVFRSATLGYYDLLSPKGVVDYGGIRPGCWINAIPAGGMVLVPDATSGCVCSYLNQAWIALQPVE